MAEVANGGGNVVVVAVQGVAEEPQPKRSSPQTMYQITLKAFVRNPELRLIRFLPPSVIIDMFQTVSRHGREGVTI